MLILLTKRDFIPQPIKDVLSSGGIERMLAAGAVTGIHDAPILLIDGKSPNKELRDYVLEKGIEKAIIVGGENSVSNNIFN